MLDTCRSWPSTYSGHLVIVNTDLAIFNNVAKVLNATLCKHAFLFALRTACAGAVAQRPRAGVQHAHLRTHCTPKYHPGTQQHTNKAYLRTRYASSAKTWLERSSDLAA